MKEAYLISCSDHYDHRMCYWDRGLQALGFAVTYVTSDFSHNAKVKFQCSVPGSEQLHVRPYTKNLSLDRILSHRGFARSVCGYLEARKPAVIVALIPPNYLCKYLALYKKRHPDVRLIFDIFDLWPETFPSSRIKSLLAPVFRIWSGLRDHNLPHADYVTVECNFFRRMLRLEDRRSCTVPFSLPPYTGPALESPLPTDRAEIAYLGAINNLIDIPRISALLAALSRRMPVDLHVIGEGENCGAFCQAAEDAGAKVCLYGGVFDETEKHRILRRCHFGLNIMKLSVCIGLTMKSVDYLRHGLPVVNSIGGDTAELVQSGGIGIQLTTPEETAAAISTAIHRGTAEMQTAALQAFGDHFSAEAASRSFAGVLHFLFSSDSRDKS